MDEYSINAKIEGDSSGFSTAIDKAIKSTNSFSKGFATTFATGGVVAGGIALATKLMGDLAKAISVVTDAYKQQAKAEIQLDTAVKNNPLMNEESSKNLKDFASEMQKVTVYGDEYLLPFMAQLTASGRTEAETMKIIQTAADIAASGAMSFDTAVTQLNATMNGSIGRMGQQNEELKSLTQEELKQGKAVDILAKKYKGMAEEVASTIGSSEKLKNAWGDLLEQIGKPIEDFLVPLRGALQKTIEKVTQLHAKWNEAREISDEINGAQKAVAEGTATEEQKITVIKEEIKQKEILLEQYKDQLNHIESISAEEAQTARNAARILTIEISSRKTLITQYKTQLQKAKDLLEEEKERLRVAKEQSDLQDAKDKKATDALTVFNQTIKNAKEEIEIRRQTGEIISEEDELREMINVKEKAYIQLIKDAEGTISGNLEREKIFVEGLVADRERLLELTKEQSTMESNTADWLNRIREQEISTLERSKEAELENAKIRRASPKEIFDIVKSYQEKELDLYIEKTNREKAQAYSEAVARGAGEEEKLAIITYYNNLITDKEKEQAEERKKIIEKENKHKVQSFTSAMKKIISTVSEMGRKLASAYADFFKGITSIVSNVFGKFKEIVNMNFDELTDTLLAFEDKVLTFFVITLPKLPQYLANILYSIATLVNNLADIIDSETIANIFTDMFRSAGELLPGIFENITTIVITLMDGLVTALETFIQSGDFFRIVDTLFESIDQIIDYVAHNILGNESIKEGIAYLVTSAFNYLPNLVTDAIDGMLNLIDALLKGLTDWIEGGGVKKLADSVLQGVAKILKYIGDNAETIANDLVDIIFDLVDSFIDNAPTLIGTLIESTLKLAGAILGKVIERLPDLIVSIIESIPDLFKTVAEAIWNGIKNAFKSIGKGLEKAWNWIGDNLGWWATGANNVPKGLAVVGESGPELVDFHGGERVYNAKNTQGILSGSSSGGNSFNVTFNNVQDTSAYAMIKELKIYQRQMAVRGGLI